MSKSPQQVEAQHEAQLAAEQERAFVQLSKLAEENSLEQAFGGKGRSSHELAFPACGLSRATASP